MDFFKKLCVDELFKLKFLIILTLIVTLIEAFQKFHECFMANPAIILIVYTHALIMLFMYFGWIFNNKYVLIFYLCFLAGIMLQWALNDWKCFVTNIENDVCVFPSYQYSDYIYRMFDANLAPIIAYSIRIIVIAIVLYKLFFY